MIRTLIQPAEVFDRESLCNAIGITDRTISREIALGRLKAYRRGKRQFFLGEDILSWLKAGVLRPEDDDEE